MTADKDPTFDPYHKWLGIPREQRPVTHYLLLGISPKETDVDVIEDAATRQSSHVRTYQLGDQAEICQRVLNEIAQARTVLLNPEKRKAYDATLPKPKAKPAPNQSAAVRSTPRRQPPKSSTGMIAGLAAGGVALVAAVVGGAVWLSSGPSSTGPSVKKSEPKAEPPKPVAIAQKPSPIPDPPKTSVAPKSAVSANSTEPNKVEPNVENPPIAKEKAGGMTIETHQWRNGMPKVATLMRKNEGIAIFGGATGSFNGFNENIKVLFNENGDWIFEGHATPQLEGYVNCVTGLSAGWFELDKATAAMWTRTNAPIELLAEDEGVCWLSGITGSLGGGEGMRVHRESGKWMIDGKSAGSDVAGRTIVLPFGKGVDRTKLRLSELAWRPKDGPLKLLDLKDGFCALTEIHGRFQSPTQQVKLTVKDGAWWIEGNDTQGSLRARVLRVSLTGKLPAISGAEEAMLVKSGPPKAVWPTKQKTPEADVLAAKQKEIQKLLPLPGAKAGADEIAKHAKAVLDVALESKDDFPLRFAALREAYELAYPLGDPDIADRASQALMLDYDVEPTALKYGALARAATKTVDPAAFRSVADAIDEFTEDAIAADDLDRAEKACAIGLVGAQKTKDAALTAAAVKRLSQIRVTAKAYQASKSALEILAKTPDDPKACLEAGRYLALVKKDWDAGLKLLAQGSDAKLKTLAQKDLDAPTDLDAREAIGDGWADLAQRDSTGIHKANAASRARRWYAMIVDEAPALKRLQIEKRLTEVEKLIPTRRPVPAARWTFDIDARDVVGTMHGKYEGNPRFAGGRMHMEPGDKMAATLTFDVSERTLELFCYLKRTDLRGNYLMFIKETDKAGTTRPGDRWDAIMFSSSAVGRISHQSENDRRSRELDIPLENSRPMELLHLAAVYAKDNTITFFRNGKLLGQPFRPERRDANNDLVTYRKGLAAIKIGSNIAMEVDEARLYTRALSAAEIATSYRTFKK